MICGLCKNMRKTRNKPAPTSSDRPKQGRLNNEKCYCLRLRVLRCFVSVAVGGWLLKVDLSLAIVSTDHGSVPTFDSGSQLSFGLALPALRHDSDHAPNTTVKHQTNFVACNWYERVSRNDHRPIV